MLPPIGPTTEIIAENGRQTPRNVRVPADVWRLSRRPAFWSDTSLWLGKVLPLLSRPIPGPEIPAGSPRPKEGPENHQRARAHTCNSGASGWEWGAPGALFGRRGGDYGRPFASEVWTICVPGSGQFPKPVESILNRQKPSAKSLQPAIGTYQVFTIEAQTDCNEGWIWTGTHGARRANRRHRYSGMGM